jgi:phosphoribosylformylglycinamidine synthase
MRVEVFYKTCYGDGRARHTLEALQARPDLPVLGCGIVDVYLLDTPVDRAALLQALADTVAQGLYVDEPAADAVLPGWDTLVEVTARPGVADPVAASAAFSLRAALGAQGAVPAVQTARQYLIRHGERLPPLGATIASALHNPLIEQAIVLSREQWGQGSRPPPAYTRALEASQTTVERFHLAPLDDTQLRSLSRARLLALSLPEMHAIREAYERPAFLAARARCGLDGRATDVELEMLAQTWSEHCKHKILDAVIHYEGPEGQRTVDSVFRSCIRGTTEAITEKRPFLASVFHDNSGVVRFDEETLICFKVETHNSPSALDPYGGAITGIVGVNRDILGTGLGAMPLFNTNVLCFGEPDTPPGDLPPGLLPPRRLLAGVHRGIVDGGNQSGIPVVAGAFVFDPSYVGKPLVFCGTGGLIPARVRGRAGEAAEVHPGDLAVMAGGRIGKDGIHGATFSSEGLSETSPTSAVQIGDPITQKKMSDFLREARDLGLYRGLTDNGAGGLSSSLGEMARKSGGVRIALDDAPLKYEGLAAWEILLSESQERMSLAVAPEDRAALFSLGQRRDVTLAVVGVFTDRGHVEVCSGGRTVALLDLEFLHDGLPRLELAAWWAPPARADTPPASLDCQAALLALLRDPNIASKERLVRQYDAEVKARSVVKPFVGAREDGPSDGAVLRPRFDSWRGITVTHGICPRYGDLDPRAMAMCAVDEAVRSHVACGGDPDQMCALDNFCWPDPIVSESCPDGAFKLGQLVRAAEGLQEACLAYRLPLVSGKDSMKNDATVGGRKVSVRPTLLVSLLGILADVRKAVTTDCKRAGDVVYLLGATRAELGGSSLERHLGAAYPGVPTLDAGRALPAYRALHRAISRGLLASAHDLSDGGLAVALFESAWGGRLGMAVDVSARSVGLDSVQALFSETPQRLLVTLHPEAAAQFERTLEGHACTRIGVVCAEPHLCISVDGTRVVDLDLREGGEAWRSL